MARFTWTMTSVDKEAEKEALNGLEKMANEIKSLSQTRCPVDTGTLRNSAVVARDDSAKKVQVGYGGAASSYSIKQHEDMHLAHAVGQAKFLETAFTEIVGKIKGNQNLDKFAAGSATSHAVAASRVVTASGSRISAARAQERAAMSKVMASSKRESRAQAKEAAARKRFLSDLDKL